MNALNPADDLPSHEVTLVGLDSTIPAAQIVYGLQRIEILPDIREKMEEIDIEIILQSAREKFPGATPRIITDNGPQSIAMDFKHLVRLCGMKHVRTSPYYPQSNGKIERYQRTIKSQCIRPLTPSSLDDAKRGVEKFVTEYITVRRVHEFDLISSVHTLNDCS